jgi:hypothetical protein
VESNTVISSAVVRVVVISREACNEPSAAPNTMCHERGDLAPAKYGVANFLSGFELRLA